MNLLANPIGQLPMEEKPRERMMRKGPSSLSNVELIAILMGSGSSKASALDLGSIIMKEYGGLQQLAQAGVQDLFRIPGLGPAKASILAAAFELGRRRIGQSKRSTRYNTPEKMFQYLRPLFMDATKEMFIALFFNNNLNLLGCCKVAEGGLNSVGLDPKVVFREAAMVNATGMVISHNHPSGNLKPSRGDELVTERILHASNLMEIQFLDHLIVTDSEYYSFRSSGRLDSAQKRIDRFTKIVANETGP